jgi:DNA-binding protein HU-beta
LGGIFLNKAEFISEVSSQAHLTKKDTETVVNAFVTTIEEALKNGDKVQLVGFGTFEVRQRQARPGRNPQTGDTIEIAAAKVPAFKAGKALKQSVEQ